MTLCSLMGWFMNGLCAFYSMLLSLSSLVPRFCNVLVFWLCVFFMLPTQGFSATAYVFVSFSMPLKLMSETLNESARLKIPAFINGLIDNSMPKTIKEIQLLSSGIPNLNLQIDPTAFERFKINQVPALVVEEGACFDVLYGNLNLKECLFRIASEGDCGVGLTQIRSLIGD